MQWPTSTEHTTSTHPGSPSAAAWSRRPPPCRCSLHRPGSDSAAGTPCPPCLGACCPRSERYEREGPKIRASAVHQTKVPLAMLKTIDAAIVSTYNIIPQRFQKSIPDKGWGPAARRWAGTAATLHRALCRGAGLVIVRNT